MKLTNDLLQISNSTIMNVGNQRPIIAKNLLQLMLVEKICVGIILNSKYNPAIYIV